MNSVRDDLFVRQLYPADLRAIAGVLDPLLRQAPYSSEATVVSLEEQLFQPAPPTIQEMQWIRHQVLGLWRGDELLGFVDLGIGFDQLSQRANDDHPLGVLRFLAVPDEYVIASRSAQILLGAAEQIWQEAGVRRVRAYAFGAGYPFFQSGAGLLPGRWDDQIRFLSEAGYRLTERYYCLRYPLRRLLMEILPTVPLVLWPHHHADVQTYQLLSQDDTNIARAQFMLRWTLREQGPVAYLSELTVAADWRRRGIGRWLLRRLINDAYRMGCRQMALHVNHAAHAAVSLFTQHGFEEINYRGYTLEKRL